MDTIILERPKVGQKKVGTTTIAKTKSHYTTRERLTNFYGSVAAKMIANTSAKEVEWGKPVGQEVW
ncbi:hypothetical protein FACS1894195_0980 [Bacteroidia bacterium]|nr:hypothetical protein FACS1894195_0980 [Bacteroidia bacterium]